MKRGVLIFIRNDISFKNKQSQGKCVDMLKNSRSVPYNW